MANAAWRAKYREEFLPSPEWQECSRTVRAERRHRCQWCGGRATEVHHLQYRGVHNGVRWVWLPPREIWHTMLKPICRDCHDAIEYVDYGTLVERIKNWRK